MKYIVSGTIQSHIQILVEAESESEAIARAYDEVDTEGEPEFTSAELVDDNNPIEEEND